MRITGKKRVSIYFDTRMPLENAFYDETQLLGTGLFTKFVMALLEDTLDPALPMQIQIQEYLESRRREYMSLKKQVPPKKYSPTMIQKEAVRIISSDIDKHPFELEMQGNPRSKIDNLML